MTQRIIRNQTVAPFFTRHEIRLELAGLWLKCADFSLTNEELEECLQKVSEIYGVELEAVKLFFELYDDQCQASDVATIFYNEREWRRDASNVFDFRVDGQMLPRLSVGVGFVGTNGGAGFVQTPYMKGGNGQWEAYERTLDQARLAVGLIDHEWVPGPHNGGNETFVLQERSE
ncbi:hypothetical protein COX05_01545 [candidate division WWE3 bacterium CG22_combo_CG10-13_8_21_14_all_39_12]|uniref:Uncharacterized protein n=2 Tax=Katanobacteria TaxID=422282 RepID=A0A2M7X2A1_UNCKA|nr:MAG: hypothetical protein COX05_01545 [candidate division WWE3 bacterium CG22_combo_CG10-13_8_21_14_all_39_12]PJA40290.1 MAG: hypothetical protein CO179_02765 [candidate division WWE3 bacterium CG_4_9_14_3_um_filter_39_7]